MSSVCPGMYAADVKRALSVVIDIDDLGEDGMRRRAVEDAWLAVRQQATAIGIGRFSFKFQVPEPGWTITFVLDVDFSSCSLRLAEWYDYLSEHEQKWRHLKNKTGFCLRLPELRLLSVDDLHQAVQTFLVGDLMDQ